MELYQSLVTVNPVTLIAQIANLFITLGILKHFFLDKVEAILDQRREAADKEIADAQTARSEAMEIKAAYEQNMRLSKEKADRLLIAAQQTAAERGDEIIVEAKRSALQLRQKAEAEIAQEKKKALNDAKNEISVIAMAIAVKVVGRELTAADQSGLVDSFIDELGDGL